MIQSLTNELKYRLNDEDDGIIEIISGSDVIDIFKFNHSIYGLAYFLENRYDIKIDVDELEKQLFPHHVFYLKNIIR